MANTQDLTARKATNVRSFDFMRPDKLNRDHLRGLQVIHENFARAFATQLSSSLRTTVQVSCLEISQQTFADYISELDNPSFLALLALSPLPGASLLYLPTSVALGLIELSLGAGKVTPEKPRPLSELEREMLKQVVRRAATDLQTAFAPVVDLEPRIAAVESNPQFVQISAPSDTVVTTQYRFQLEGLEGDASFCMPFATMQPVMEELSRGSLFTSDIGVDPAATASLMSGHVEDTMVTATAEFRAVSLTSTQIMALGPGDVIPLEHPVDTPLLLRVNGIPVFSVRPGTQGRRAAVFLDGLAPGAKVRR